MRGDSPAPYPRSVAASVWQPTDSPRLRLMRPAISPQLEIARPRACGGTPTGGPRLARMAGGYIAHLGRYKTSNRIAVAHAI
jgi:hypothetical protein